MFLIKLCHYLRCISSGITYSLQISCVWRDFYKNLKGDVHWLIVHFQNDEQSAISIILAKFSPVSSTTYTPVEALDCSLLTLKLSLIVWQWCMNPTRIMVRYYYGWLGSLWCTKPSPRTFHEGNELFIHGFDDGNRWFQVLLMNVPNVYTRIQAINNYLSNHSMVCQG